MSLLEAQEGALALQKEDVQEATKEVLKQEQTKKRKKDQAKAKKKKKTKVEKEGPEAVEITPAIREAYQKAKKKKKVKKAKVQETPQALKSAEKLLAKFAKFRAPYTVYWDPAELSDPPAETAIRNRDEEHVKEVAEAMWVAKECFTQKPWIIFQFDVSFILISKMN
jgi:hypothetical protein